MVVLAASICTKAGKPVISRQFREMPRSRIESLLASFPRLIPTNTQHTSVETPDVRYVYQPLENLYILVITNKASNILQDIDTLHLFARVVADICKSAEEREILRNAFQLLSAFDEIVSLGLREQINLMQVRSVLEMESHEERIQDIISRNKEAEAKEELKRRAKQLEMQRREQQRRAAAGGSGAYLGVGGGVSGYSPLSSPRFDAPSPPPTISQRIESPAPSSTRAPSFKGSGMKLGAKRSGKTAELIEALGGEAVTPDNLSAPGTPAPDASATGLRTDRGSLPVVQQESVHVQVKESVSLTLDREGGVRSLDIRGDMNLLISDSSLACVRLALADTASPTLQFKQHPNVAKFSNVDGERAVALKDANRSFPVGQSLAVLKWRYSGRDERMVPLSITCWPTASNDGTCEVHVEYELEHSSATLYDVVISLPLPSGSYPTVTDASGSYAVNAARHTLDWTIPVISADNTSGSLECSVPGTDPDAFFPLQAGFVSDTSVSGVSLQSVAKVENGASTTFSNDVVLLTESYIVE